ncbi:hypothetical protein [Oligoflexus tunisiensis]|uniref:hypothetical protein n=1 Tax=Oligoflexus tunisiensis TaxID=708132 RepID=UPI00114D387C|nr:hypothetical protein [Oligoflexus tunisiensis]
MRLFPLTILLGLGLTPPAWAQMQSRYNSYQLDKEEAHLNKQWKRVEEVATAHARYQKIRKDMIIQGYQRSMETWFNDLNAWLQGWDPVLEAMEGDNLADEDRQKAMLDLIKVQLANLDAMTARISGIKRMGTQAYDALDALPFFPADYIDVLETSQSDTYGPQIQVYWDQVQSSKRNLLDSQDALTEDTTKSLQDMTRSLDKAVVLKMKALAVQFPRLRAAVAKTEAALVQLRHVDSVIVRYQNESAAIAKEIMEEKIFASRNHLDDWKKRIDDEIRKIETNRDIPKPVARYGRDSLQGLVRVREAQYADQQRTRSKLQIFASFYDKEMYGTFGMVKACLRPTRPAAMDCNRLRLIQGFKPSQILQLDEKAAAFMESEIIKSRGQKI